MTQAQRDETKILQGSPLHLAGDETIESLLVDSLFKGKR